LYCGKCGAEMSESAERCSACGQAVGQSDGSQNSAERGPSPARQIKVAYAGFWLRAVAFLIDLFIVLIFIGPPMLYLLGKNVGTNATPQAIIDFAYSGTRQAIAINLLVDMAYWLYSASLESSVWQATAGKKLLGLYVTDVNGKRISFARASGRFIGKSLEQLTLFIGFLAAGFTARKQALHDIVAGCLVLRKV
jgi:uncharacterized RDD family membrane protein YckC